MPVQSIECQLTQAQVKRYLAGADFPDEIISAVERHLKACPDCMARANSQRESLGGAPADIAQAVVEAQPKPKKLAGLAQLVKPQKKVAQQPQGLIAPRGAKPYPTDALSAIKTPKNLILSGSLAVVLVVMSTVMRNPTNVLGPKADVKIAATTDKSEATEAKAETKKSSDEPETTETVEAAVDTQEMTPMEPKATKTNAETDVNTSVAAKTTEAAKKPHALEHPATPTVKPATHEASTTSTKKEPANADHNPVGGAVIVAEAGSHVNREPKVAKTTHKVVTHSKTVKRPPLKKSTRLQSRKSTTNSKRAPQKSAVRVYLPDGSPKSH